jgi:2,3-bisphosphoglycerate-independent phosphoglycerate mutase
VIFVSIRRTNSGAARGTADQQHLVVGCRKRPQIPSFRDKYGLTGAVISAVDLHKGLAICRVGADQRAWRYRWLDTNYAGGRNALKALEDKDFVFLRVEAPDEAVIKET